MTCLLLGVTGDGAAAVLSADTRLRVHGNGMPDGQFEDRTGSKLYLGPSCVAAACGQNPRNVDLGQSLASFVQAAANPESVATGLRDALCQAIQQSVAQVEEPFSCLIGGSGAAHVEFWEVRGEPSHAPPIRVVQLTPDPHRITVRPEGIAIPETIPIATADELIRTMRHFFEQVACARPESVAAPYEFATLRFGQQPALTCIL